MEPPFVLDDFVVPVGFSGPGFRLEPLGPPHNERDHEAWMSSIDHIQSTPGYGPGAEWPAPMSMEANLSDLEMHATHFVNREGFTYSVLDGDDVVGCLYIYPASGTGHDASIRSWVRASRPEMDVVVYRSVSAWLRETWPFENPDYAARPETSG